MILPGGLRSIFRIISALTGRDFFISKKEAIHMRLLTKIAQAMVCLCAIPLCGISFGQDMSAGEMAVKGEQIKPIPGVSVEMALARQQAKDDLVVQKQALENDPPVSIPRPILIPDENKPIEMPVPKDKPISEIDTGIKKGPIVQKPKPGLGDESLIGRPIMPIVIPIPRPNPVFRFWPPIIRLPKFTPPRFTPPTLEPPARICGLPGSVVTIIVEETKKKILQKRGPARRQAP
jgi:hypothetical protein